MQTRAASVIGVVGYQLAIVGVVETAVRSHRFLPGQALVESLAREGYYA